MVRERLIWKIERWLGMFRELGKEKWEEIFEMKRVKKGKLR